MLSEFLLCEWIIVSFPPGGSWDDRSGDGDLWGFPCNLSPPKNGWFHQAWEVHQRKMWLWCELISTYGYGSIPISTIFRVMNIHKSQLFWGSLGVLLVLTHCHIEDGLPTFVGYEDDRSFNGFMGGLVDDPQLHAVSPHPNNTPKQYHIHQRMNENSAYTQRFWL